jgi:hypothetical protein
MSDSVPSTAHTPGRRRRKRSPLGVLLSRGWPIALGLVAVGLLAATALGGIDIVAPAAMLAVAVPIVGVASIVFTDTGSRKAAKHRRG